MGRAARGKRRVLVAGLLTALTGTASGSAASGAAAADGWVRDCPSDAFCFMRPADLVLQPGLAIDSLAARYRGPRLELRYDLGRYATSLAHLKQPAEQATTVDGRPARVLIAGNEVVLVVPRVHETGGVTVQMTMTLRFDGAASLPLAQRVFGSIRFAPPR